MGSITLEQANKIIEAILKRGAEMDCRPISAVVVEPGCIVKAFQKEDGASMVRFEMALGKAYAALALSRSSKLVRVRHEGGGMQIRGQDGEVIGAVGVTGDTEDKDEELAVHGIHSAGLKTDDDVQHMGRKFRTRLTAAADGR